MSRQVISTSEKATFEEGRRLGLTLSGGAVVALSGCVGAGKTVFAKGIAVGLGVSQTVTSPTFALFNIYQGTRLSLYHFDFYRLEDSQLEETGIEEYIGAVDGVCVVEWASSAPEIVLPPTTISVHIAEISASQRRISYGGDGA